MVEKACRNCKLIVSNSDTCPICKSTDLTTSWKGYVIILDPEKSEIAKKLDAKIPGKYAIRLTK